jgi:CubicO group peptidase (beta-lactamase class C family)
MKPEDKLKIASMTKVFTALLTMKLVEEGKIDLKETIGRYFPAYKGPGRDLVTIHQLLTYSSGIANLLEPQGMKPYQTRLSLDSFIDLYCSGQMVDTPGLRSNYANTEYVLLHKIIERVSGKSYEAYLNHVILKPLELTNTGVARAGKKIPRLVQAYTYNDSTRTFSRDEDYLPEMYFGAGFLYSTAQDLLTLDNAIFNNRLLKKQTTDQLLTINENIGYTAYGFWGSTGWGNFQEPFYYRTGGILGSTSNWIHAMNSRKTVIVLSNNNATNLYELSEKIYLLKH